MLPICAQRVRLEKERSDSKDEVEKRTVTALRIDIKIHKDFANKWNMEYLQKGRDHGDPKEFREVSVREDVNNMVKFGVDISETATHNTEMKCIMHQLLCTTML